MVIGYVFVAAVPPPLTAVTDAVLATLPPLLPASTGLAVNAVDGLTVAASGALPPKVTDSFPGMLADAE
jgi:hypothetical protein